MQTQLNKRQEISTWILAHSQLAIALNQAWEKYNERDEIEQLEMDEVRQQKLEREKIISKLVQEAWETKIDEEKKRATTAAQNKKVPIIDGDCLTYNIHQEQNINLGLKDVTLWRLVLNNQTKLDSGNLGGNIELQALEYSTRDNRKKKIKK